MKTHKKEYHFDCKQTTAKKGRKQEGQITVSENNISLFTNYNCSKYHQDIQPDKKKERVVSNELKQLENINSLKKYPEFKEQSISHLKSFHQNSKQKMNKKPLNTQQFKMMIRCIKKYCQSKQQTSLKEGQTRLQLATKIFTQLRQGYYFIGKKEEIKRNELLLIELQSIMPAKAKNCLCSNQPQNMKCYQLQRRYLNENIIDDISKKQMRFEQLKNKSAQLIKIKECKQGGDNLQKLKCVYNENQRLLLNLDLQLKQLDQLIKEGKYCQNYNQEIELFIDEEL